MSSAEAESTAPAVSTSTGSGAIASDTALRRLLVRSGALLEAHVAVDRALQRHAISKTELDSYTVDLLFQLMLTPGRRLRGVEVAQQLLISPPSTTRLIDRAEEAGLVERTPDPDDRRAQQIVVTAEGERRVQEFSPAMLEVFRQVFGEFTTAELRTLTGLLVRVRDAAREVAARDEL